MAFLLFFVGSLLERASSLFYSSLLAAIAGTGKMPFLMVFFPALCTNVCHLLSYKGIQVLRIIRLYNR